MSAESLVFNSVGPDMNLHIYPCTSQRTQCANIRKTGKSLLNWEIITIYCKYHIKQPNVKWGQNSAFGNVKSGVT
jgi:hypothetical protein